MMCWHTSTVLSLALAGVGFASTVLTPEKPNAACSFKNVVALGDSYAAGLQSYQTGELPLCKSGQTGYYAPLCTSSSCARNQYSYSYQFTQLYRPQQYGFLPCTGATTTDILNNQLPNIKDTPDLITITLGGDNQNAFADVVGNCVYPNPIWDPLDWAGYCDDALVNATAAITAIDMALDKVLYQNLYKKYPHAQMTVLGYVRFWPNDDNFSASNCPSEFIVDPTTIRRTTMNFLVTLMNLKLSRAAAKARAIFVDPNDWFDGHRFCEQSGAQPWFHSSWFNVDFDRVYNRGVFHPIPLGQLQYLDALQQGLQQALNCTLDLDAESSAQTTQVQVEL